MNPRRLIACLASRAARGRALRTSALLGAIGAASPIFAAAPIDAAVYKHTNKRIEALFQLRDQPLTFVNTRNNPFRTPGALAASVVVVDSDLLAESDDEASELTDAERLRLAAETLKVTGVMHVGNQVRLTINRSNYAVGDILQVKLNGQTLDLRVANIADKTVTLRLNAADYILNF